MAYLENPLKFTFVPSGQTYTGTDGTTAGTLLFDEVKKTIKVRDIEYGLDSASATNLANSLTALKNAGLMSETNGAYSAVQLTTAVLDAQTPQNATIQSLFENVKDLIDAINTKIGSLGEGDIAGRISALDTAVQNAAQAAQAAQNTADAKVASVAGETGNNALIGVSGTTAVTISSTEKLQNAVAAAETALQQVVLTGASGNLFTKNGTTVQGVIAGTNILVGNSSTGATASAYSDASISVAIDALNRAISALAGSGDDSLANKIQLIDDIYAELTHNDTEDGENDPVQGIIDALRKLKLQTTEYFGISDTGAAGTANNRIALQTSLEHLANYVRSQSQAAQNAAASDATDKANAAQTAAIQATNDAKAELLGVSGTSGNTIISAKADAAAALSAAQAAAGSHSTVQGVTGATAGTTNFVMVTETVTGTGTSTEHKNYTVQSTQALNDAITGAMQAAQAAQTAAGQTISWDVVGETGTSGS